ncbi:MAG: L-threonylcarbamoyladenylate synthase [Flavobacteriales bacterium]|jgi:L-threonylcarbamoyladenylate synthase|nr:L-threonylcarbamoyladenylate synthase [Flavobacteriales bacterium]
MKEEVEIAIEVLENKGTIVYPTDTIWGIGCDATSAEAVEKIFEVKGRSKEKSLIILLDDDRKLNKYIREIPEVAWDILDHANTPTTIVYPGAINLPKQLIAKDGSVAIRIVKEGFAYELIKKFKKPIVSTSANISGELSPTNREDISDNVLKKVNHVVNLPSNSKNRKSSSILKLQIDGQIEIIRK